jgi:alpha-1,2-mannosyltransferase
MAAVALFLLAVAGYALLVHASPQYYWTQIDTAVYRDSGITVRNQPAMLYALGFGAAKLPFIYTPFAALLFAAGSGASFAAWQVGLAVLTIGLLPVVAYLSLGLAGQPAGLARAAAAVALAAVGLWLEPVAMTLFFGQVNLVLLALVVGDLALPDRSKGKGIGIGLAAGIKLTPLIFIPYLLFTRRVKAAAVSALTFAVTVGLGFALLPRASAVYWGGQLLRPSKHFHLDNQSLNGVILRFTHAGPDAHAYWLVAAVVVGIAGLATSILASRRGHELLGLVTSAGVPGHLVAPLRLRGTGTCPRRVRATAARLPDPRRRAGGGLVWLVALAYWQPGRLRPSGPAAAARAAASRTEPGQLRGSRVHLARAGIGRRQLLRAHPACVYRGHRVRPGACPSPQA